MRKKLYIPIKTRQIIVSYCNTDIVPETNYSVGINNRHTHEIDWFKDYFDFVDDAGLKTHLAEAYYQARFLYKIMQGLHLTSFKRTSIIKFQIQQYASIYEALIDYTLEKYHKNEVKEQLQETEFKIVNVLSQSSSITMTVDGKQETVYTCKKTKRNVPLKKTRIDKRTELAKSFGIISDTVKNEFDGLYDLRNNIHILKAVTADYRPKIEEATKAFQLMEPIHSSIKLYVLTKKNGA
jgi:hypothetical protein